MIVDILTCIREHACMAGKLSLSDQIRRAVSGCGISQYRLAKELRIDKAALSRFVRGERGLSWEAVDRLATFLDLRITTGKHRRKKP